MDNNVLEAEESSNNARPVEIFTIDISNPDVSKSDDQPPHTTTKPSDNSEASISVMTKSIQPADKIKHKKISKKKIIKPNKNLELECQNKSNDTMAEITLNHQIGNLSQRLEKCQLEPITIDPGPNTKTISITHEESVSPRVIKLNQTFKFPSDFEAIHEEKHSPTKECFTQTSKTFVPKLVAVCDQSDQVGFEEISNVSDNVVSVEVRVPARERSPAPVVEDTGNYVFPVNIPFNKDSPPNENICMMFPQKNADAFGNTCTMQRFKLPPIPTKHTNSYTTASTPHIHHLSWPQAVITGPAEQPKLNPCVFPPIGDTTYRIKSQPLPSIPNPSAKYRQENLKRNNSQRPMEPSLNLQSPYRPNQLCDMVTESSKPAMMGSDCETRTRSEPFILPALNNQNRPELQILQRLLPPNRSVMSEPCECPGSSGEITPCYNKVSPVSSKSPDMSWRYAPQAVRSDTSNEYTYESRHRPDDLSIQVYSRTKISPRLNREKSSIAAGSRLSFHSSTKFSPRNDNYSIISQKTGKSIGYRESRPTSGSICKRRVNKYSNVAPRYQQRKIVDRSPRIKSNVPQRHSYKFSNTEEHNPGSETESSGTRTSCTATAESVSLPKALAHINSDDWCISLSEMAMKGMTEIVELSRHMDYDALEQEMPPINRKIIQMLRSPRSQACRVACEVSGELFVTMKLTKRPEFDEIVDLLLCKTADTNRFIRKDANIALDRMVTYIPPFHAVRALCSKGPGHKNHLVRCATVRLLVCIAVLAGTDNILTSNEYTRKRMFTTMAKFLMDKHLDTRKYAERLFKMFKRNKYFEEAFYRDVDMDIIEKLGKSLLRLSRK